MMRPCVPHGRRTHSAHHTLEEAKAGAHQLIHMLNGVPFGYVMAIQEKMGKFAVISYLREQPRE